MRDHWWSRNSSSFYGREAYGGDSIGVCVGLPVELLAKDIWIDFPITEVAGIELQNGLQGFEEGIGAANNGRAAIENEPSAGLEPIKALLDDPHRERNAELASAMAIEAPIVIHEVGRICHNDVSGTFDAREHVAEHAFAAGTSLMTALIALKAMRFAVDIAEHNLCFVALSAEPPGRSNATRATAAPDIDEP